MDNVYFSPRLDVRVSYLEVVGGCYRFSGLGIRLTKN